MSQYSEVELLNHTEDLLLNDITDIIGNHENGNSAGKGFYFILMSASEEGLLSEKIN